MHLHRTIRRAVGLPRRRTATVAIAATSLAVGVATFGLTPTAWGLEHQASAGAEKTTVQDTNVCKQNGRSRNRCFAIRVDHVSSGRIEHAVGPMGFSPADLTAAYSLPSSTAGSGETVAIVDAYDDPGAAADLAVYREEFGLPACTSAAGCFRKVDQTGGTDYPSADAGWGEEISLDLDMVSAICPQCHILLVEADSSAQANLGAAEDEAAKLGADAISNSYGGPDASDNDYGRYYHHPGIAITASAGDNGYGVSYPASSEWVTSVGGTSLSPSSQSSRGWTESAWSGTGSGCSTDNAASWQSSSLTGCDGRAVADVSAVADPATGVAVYDSNTDDGASGWLVFGGTSAASPIIAATYALAGNTASIDDGSWPWTHHTAGQFNDVISGSNGSCTTIRWCEARSGWDGPTGWGSPHGIGGF